MVQHRQDACVSRPRYFSWPPYLAMPPLHYLMSPARARLRAHPLNRAFLRALPLAATPKTLGLNRTRTLEAHVITADDETACFAAGHGQFPCSESVSNGGLGAPPLNDTEVGLCDATAVSRPRCYQYTLPVCLRLLHAKVVVIISFAIRIQQNLSLNMAMLTPSSTKAL